jgi:uncharacterized protein YbjT (DUF2867 family)
MILVTGATGRVGGEVVRQLAGAGVGVRAFVRDASAARAELPTGVEIAQGDFEHPETLTAAMQGVEKMPRPVVEGLLEVFARIKAGKAAHGSEDVERVTGKPPRRFDAWVTENVAAFR